MNIENVDRDELEECWVSPHAGDGIRTLMYKEFESGQVFGYWAEFRPNGCEIWSDGCKDIEEYKKTTLATKIANIRVSDTPIEEVNKLSDVSSAYYVDDDMVDDCYYFYTLSFDGKLIYKIPCYIKDDGYTSYPEEDFMCETYTVIDGITEGFE